MTFVKENPEKIMCAGNAENTTRSLRTLNVDFAGLDTCTGVSMVSRKRGGGETVQPLGAEKYRDCHVSEGAGMSHAGAHVQERSASGIQGPW